MRAVAPWRVRPFSAREVWSAARRLGVSKAISTVRSTRGGSVVMRPLVPPGSAFTRNPTTVGGLAPSGSQAPVPAPLPGYI